MKYISVQTNNGTFSGFSGNGVHHFYGIPYGKARRFHKAEEVVLDKPYDAFVFGYTCPNMRKEISDGDFLVPRGFYPASEDCLNLNIITPDTDNKKGVVVWIHGGEYSYGSANSSKAVDGERIAQEGFVFVSINHRLNILGFFDLSEYGEEYKESAMLGIEDLALALRWIKKNIEAFGGDKDNITLTGNSGGGGKIIALMQSSIEEGLFHRAVISSGHISRIVGDAQGTMKPLVDAMIKKLNLTDIKELETVSYEDLSQAYLELKKQYPQCQAERLKKNDFYMGNPLVHGFKTHSIPILTGNTYAEFTSLMMKRAPLFDDDQNVKLLNMMYGSDAATVISEYKKTYPYRVLSDLLTIDTMFRYETIQFIDRYVREGGTIYNYLFEGVFDYHGSLNAWHCADLPYLFHNTDKVPICDTVNRESMESEMFSMFTQFVRDGNPGFNNCREGKFVTKVVGDNTAVKENHGIELQNAIGKHPEGLFILGKACGISPQM